MRVLHAAAEIAAQAGVLAEALRGVGVAAESWAYNAEYNAFPSDRALGYDARPILPRVLGYLKTTLQAAGRFDLLHVHFGRSLVPPLNLDLPLHAALGTPMVFHFHGCEVRNRLHMLQRHARAACTECDPFCVPARQKQVIAQARRYGRAILVSTPDLLESVPDAEHFPVAIDLDRWSPLPPAEWQPSAPGRLRVLHAPTNRLIKGTRLVVEAVEAARRRVPGIEFELLEGVPWLELRERMRRVDVVVDQMFLGWYGLTAVEAMALEKPVLGFLRADFEPRAGDLPLLRVESVASLANALVELAEDAVLRSAAGAAGRAYAARVHAAPVLARRLLALYETVVARKSA